MSHFDRSYLARRIHIQNIGTGTGNAFSASLYRIFDFHLEKHDRRAVFRRQFRAGDKNENESKQRFHARFGNRIIFFAACFGIIEPYAAASAGVTWLR